MSSTQIRLVLVLVLLTSPLAAQQVLHRIDGQTAGARLGVALVGLHDLDSDGVPELAAADGQGRVLVFDGATGSPRFTIVGPANTSFGAALAPVLDADQDGTPDIAIGAPALGNAALPGSVHIHSGLDGSLIRSLVAGQAGDHFGCCLAVYGDLDQNGSDDLVIGASHHDKGGIQDCGAILIFDPASGQQLLQIEGAAWNESFGAAVAVLGDLNGDSLPELAVGAPLGNQTGTIIGLYGGSGLVQVLGSGGTWNPIATLLGQAADDFFGSALAAVGDVDGNGSIELAIGIPGHDGAAGASIGRVEIRALPFGQLVAARDGLVGGERYGDRLAAPGDCDGDFIPDLLVGAPFSGSIAQGRVELVRGLDAQPLFQDLGVGPFENLGDSLASLGDFGFDGLGEFAYGAPGVTTSASFAGRLLSRSYRAGVYGAAALGALGAPLLRVDGQPGAYHDGRCERPLGQPFLLGLDQPSGSPLPANFVLWAAFGIPAATAGEELPYGLGRLVLPCVALHPGLQPWLFTLVDGFGLGLPALVPAGPTPFVVANPGIGYPLTVTMQALVEHLPGQFGLSNALVLVIG
ncbi:MAG: FG-GAP repeat protein [Planctomycetes bacterium]|nr:FG-GAP repeat protein [Planctomycetota bacterium]